MDPVYRIIVYPFTYGTEFFDASTVTSSTSTMTFQQKDTVSVTGYGTLKLPGGRVFKNVLQEQTTTAISYVDSGHMVTNFSYSISYFAKGYHYPLLSISFNAAHKIEDAKAL